MCYIQYVTNKHHKDKIIHHKERSTDTYLRWFVEIFSKLEWLTWECFPKHTKKCQMESTFFFANSMLCQYVVFPLTLSLSLPLDKTRYSASSPYFGILHCTALVYNPFASFKIHGKPPLDIFLLLLLALQKHSLSLVSNVKWTYCSTLIIHSLSCLFKPVWLTFFLSWITEDDILISLCSSFLRTHTMSRGFQVPKNKQKNCKIIQFVSYTCIWTYFIVLLCPF